MENMPAKIIPIPNLKTGMFHQIIHIYKERRKLVKKELRIFRLAIIISFTVYLILGIFIPVSNFLYPYSPLQILWLSVPFLIPLILMYIVGWYFIKLHQNNHKWTYLVAGFPWAYYLFLFGVTLIYLSLAGVGAAGAGNAGMHNFIPNLKIALGIAGYLSLPIGTFVIIILSVDVKKYLWEFYVAVLLIILQLIGVLFYISFLSP